MNTIPLGPLAMPTTIVMLAASVLVAVLVARHMAGAARTSATDRVMTCVICAAIGARAVFVMRYWTQYAGAPWSMLDIRDGGFDWRGALGGGAVCAAYFAWRLPALRRALAASVIAGVVSFGAFRGLASLLNLPAFTRPTTTLARLDDHTTSLTALAKTQPAAPMVVNLWATWCPPCRAELPMLVAAQRTHPDVLFVFVDEGETPSAVRQYLAAHQLQPNNLLLDGTQALANATRTRGFPSTYFFAPDGRLVTSHIGMLSPATLARALDQLKEEPTSALVQEQ
ncbi:MAG TPA: TlpA disulfide reductase family protein [Nevskiaceae bacterium]|nr:TlpA disulfide reductase family protein [Nevskiaceae bacterium]